MLKEVKVEGFWSRLPIKPKMIKNGEINQYVDDTGRIVGYIHTFSRRYFLVERTEPGDFDVVFKASKLASEEKKEEAKVKAAKKPDDMGKKYPHALMESRRLDVQAKKQQVRIRCTTCGDTNRWVYTSDLWQVKICESCYRKLNELREQIRKGDISSVEIITGKGTSIESVPARQEANEA